MSEKYNKILTVQDLSCVGQCSLTVALPILSAFGAETCVLPTALLSEHTMFKNFTFLDLAQNMVATAESWEKDGHRFAAVYTGYLGDKKHFRIVGDIIDALTDGDAAVIVDPVFGDNGKLYPLFDEEYVAEVRSFIRKSDIILPNITEACFLTGVEYKTVYGKEYIEKLVGALADLGDFDVVLTGVEKDGLIGFAHYDAATKGTEYYFSEKLPQSYHGTGDIFASVFTGAYLSGSSLYDSAKAAAQFVALAIAATDEGHDYGVQFEKVLAPFAAKFIG